MTGKRLLILDDDESVGQTLKSIAELCGAEVLFTPCPKEFFEAVKEFSPTHIAIDLAMPEMDGVQVMQLLAEQSCMAKIIISSGQGSRVVEAAGRSASIHGLHVIGALHKPFSVDQVRDLLSLEACPSSQGDCFESPHLHETTVTEAAIIHALAQQEFHVVYQPKVDCGTSLLAGFEALARWVHPKLGFVSPETFIGLAEQTGHIDEMTKLLFDEALVWFAGFNQKLLNSRAMRYSCSDWKAITLSLNVSAKSLPNANLFEWIMERCLKLGIDPSRVVLELTETSNADDLVGSMEVLTRLRLKGFQLSIDDFGTGFSSMLQLVRMPFSEIKIDRSFVMSASSNEEYRTVIRSIIYLGHSLGLTCTAEGLEDAQTLEYLRDLGCDLAQGYYFARPMPASEIDGWISGKFGVSA